MRALDRKLLRDLGRLKMQAIAIALVVAAGTAVFIGMAATARALRLSEERYYDEHRFAHVWTRLVRAPDGVLREIGKVPGVSSVEGRLVAQGVIDIPGLDEPATGLFIALPPTHGHVLNDLYIRRVRARSSPRRSRRSQRLDWRNSASLWCWILSASDRRRSETASM